MGLSACQGGSLRAPFSVAREQQQFQDAFAQYQRNNDASVLESFVANYPQSQGADLCRVLIDLDRRLAQRNHEIVTLQQQIADHDRQVKTLRKDKGKLKETIEQLKVSLIEQERLRK